MIFFQLSYGDNQRKMLVSHVNDQGNQWNQGSVQFTMAEYNMIFEATIGSGGPATDIAIDEISMARRSCGMSTLL